MANDDRESAETGEGGAEGAHAGAPGAMHVAPVSCDGAELRRLARTTDAGTA